MTWFPDLEPISYFGFTSPQVLGVGWLDAPHEFARGPIDSEDLDALAALGEMALRVQPVIYRGRHECTLCGGPSAHLNLFVFDGDDLLIAPALVFHYVRDHGYRPPDRFLAAVRAATRRPARERNRDVMTLWNQLDPPRGRDRLQLAALVVDNRYEVMPLEDGRLSLDADVWLDVEGQRVTLRARADAGVLVDGEPATDLELIDGDEIRVGDRIYELDRFPGP
jgi:hypothetical protein